MKKQLKLLVLFSALFLIFSVWGFKGKDAQAKTYTVTTNSKPINKTYTTYSTYNKNTKNYYVFRALMETLEKSGGGKIIVKKGTYTLTNTIYVPSNVTIELSNGVVIKKAKKAGASSIGLSSSLFQLIAPSKSNKDGAVGSYSGTKNVKIYSKGRATIDLQKVYNSIAIIMGHNQNVTIQNIDFKNMNSGHFIEMDASKKVVVNNSTFKNSTASANYVKEAINLDTPDKFTGGFSSNWSKFDRTANMDVTIKNSVFDGLDRAIGTHKYSGKGKINGKVYTSKPHKDIKIINNKISNTRNDAIRVNNWYKPVIKGNHFNKIGQGNSGLRGVLVSGATYPVIENNSFENVGRAVQFLAWKNPGKLTDTKYDIIYNKLTKANLASLEKNTGKNLSEYVIRISKEYNVFTNQQVVNIIEK
ncbi:MAG: right-handed parallel beta-helix repeat-containing protein [Kurthia sp.]|nr:right-handed parallel beta-helix repeat-containing protein [Candidatus Kurthia equi]